MTAPTSGTALVDELVDGVRIGDNLVLIGSGPLAPLDLLVDRFLIAARRAAPLVVVNIAGRSPAPAADGTTVLDWSRTATIDDAIADLHRADEAVGEGAAFVFDRLTAVQEAWGADAPLTLFLAACPRLYRRRSLALWPIERAEHRPTFLRRLTEITQVVVELDTDDDGITLTVRKADGRGADVVGRSVRAEVVDGDLVATGPRTTAREQLGTIIRAQRLARDLSQADVARRVGITPSALSQVERGVRGPSGDTLMRLWEVLGVPFGPSASGSRDASGYRVSRRSGRERAEPQPGLTAEQVLGGEVEQWLLELEPGAAGQRPPFAVKRPESAVVLRGVVEVAFGGHVETLHEGDGFLADDVVITSWANPGTTVAELLWTLHHQPSRRHRH